MHAGLDGRASLQGGVFTAAQALAAGYSRDEVRARLTSGRWLRVRRGIFRAAGEVDERLVAAAAAVLSCRVAVASHRTAAHLQDMPVLERHPRVDLTVPQNSRTTSVRGCRVFHAPLPQPPTRVHGVPTTDVPRTVVDIARDGTFDEAVVAADHALRLRCGPDDLERAARRLRGLPGHGKVRRVLDFADGRAESPGESLTRVVLARHGLPAPVLGWRVERAGTLLGVVDLAWPAHGTVVEFDGQLKYAPDNDHGADRLWHEKLREDGLRDSGLEVVRVSWSEVTRRPHTVADRVRAAFGRAATRPAAS